MKLSKRKTAVRYAKQKWCTATKNNERILNPLIRKNGRLVAVSLDEAIHTAAQILTDAKYPLLYGWGASASEAQRTGVE
jgi:formylmethanofuran dehydrogenase subunit B